MLYTGNNIGVYTPTSFDEYGNPQKSKEVQKIEDSISLFDEKKAITRQSLHYASLCGDLANESKSGLISFLTGTVQNGMQSLAGLNVHEDNSGFLQDTVKGLANNLRDSATAAQERVQQETMSAARAEQQREVSLREAEDVQFALDKTIDNIDSVSSPDKGNDHNIFEVNNENNSIDEIDEQNTEVSKETNTNQDISKDAAKITEIAKANDAIKTTNVAKTTDTAGTNLDIAA